MGIVQGVNSMTAAVVQAAPDAAPQAGSDQFRGMFEQAAAGSTTGSSRNNPQKIADAARQFEGLMISQILKSAHDDDAGWLGAGDEDDTSSTAIGMAEEYLGQAIANGGGLGIAKMVVRGFGTSASTPASSGPHEAAPVASHKD